jgi:hypothetical protein
MANRVLIGKRGSDYGLFVSKSGDDVVTTTNPLSFDSRAVESLNVHTYGQGILVPDVTNTSGTQLTFTYSGTTYSQHEIDIGHSLGYSPAFVVRYTTIAHLSSGVATKVWSANVQQFSFTEYEEDEEVADGGGGDGLQAYITSSANQYKLRIRNEIYREHQGTNEHGSLASSAVYAYSYIIFKAENFLGGFSL